VVRCPLNTEFPGWPGRGVEGIWPTPYRPAGLETIEGGNPNDGKGFVGNGGGLNLDRGNGQRYIWKYIWKYIFWICRLGNTRCDVRNLGELNGGEILLGLGFKPFIILLGEEGRDKELMNHEPEQEETHPDTRPSNKANRAHNPSVATYGRANGLALLGHHIAHAVEATARFGIGFRHRVSETGYPVHMPVSKGRKKAKKRPTPPSHKPTAIDEKGPSPTWYVSLS